MKFVLLASIFIINTLVMQQDSFLEQQLKFARVRSALDNKGSALDSYLKASGLKRDDFQILIEVFKDEEELVLYAKRNSEAEFKIFRTYSFCASSGGLGPKRKSGDLQIPEGFYFIDRYNPKSNFHLSLGINYPNRADKIKTTASDPGGDIFIHGGCVTIGCLPMTDGIMEEIYLFAVFARTNGQLKIPVYIYPFKMTSDNIEKYRKIYSRNPELIVFWKNLQEGFQKFEASKKLLNVSVDLQGNYIF